MLEFESRACLYFLMVVWNIDLTTQCTRVLSTSSLNLNWVYDLSLNGRQSSELADRGWFSCASLRYGCIWNDVNFFWLYILGYVEFWLVAFTASRVDCLTPIFHRVKVDLARSRISRRSQISNLSQVSIYFSIHSQSYTSWTAVCMHSLTRRVIARRE